MRPLTYYVNKGMIPINGKPILEHIITKLEAHGFSELIIAISHLGEQVENYFGRGDRYGVTIRYVHSETPVGTAGEVHKIRGLLDSEEHFLVHYGDIITDLDTRALARKHHESQAAATVGLVTGVRVHTGIACLDDEDNVTEFEEKPAFTLPTHAAVNCFAARALAHFREGEDIATDVIPELIAAGEKVVGYVDRDAYWQDVGRLSDLDDATKLL
jgi:NDP-sugar pyrophosphorylase family protein